VVGLVNALGARSHLSQPTSASQRCSADPCGLGAVAMGCPHSAQKCGKHGTPHTRDACTACLSPSISPQRNRLTAPFTSRLALPRLDPRMQRPLTGIRVPRAFALFAAWQPCLGCSTGCSRCLGTSSGYPQEVRQSAAWRRIPHTGKLRSGADLEVKGRVGALGRPTLTHGVGGGLT
jgi:hypothetical protein